MRYSERVREFAKEYRIVADLEAVLDIVDEACELHHKPRCFVGGSGVIVEIRRPKTIDFDVLAGRLDEKKISRLLQVRIRAIYKGAK